MATQQFYEDDEDDDALDDVPTHSDSEWAELRRAKKAKEKAEKELAVYKRAEVFGKAGLDTSDPRFAYFTKAYEGEMTAEAIKAEALRVGLIQAEPEAPEGDPQELETAQRIQQASGEFAYQPDLVEAGLQQAFEEGGSEAMMQFLASQGIPSRVTQ